LALGLKRIRQAKADSPEMKKEQVRTETISSFFVSMAGGFFTPTQIWNS
jgi:hypothetical protein